MTFIVLNKMSNEISIFKNATYSCNRSGFALVLHDGTVKKFDSKFYELFRRIEVS